MDSHSAGAANTRTQDRAAEHLSNDLARHIDEMLSKLGDLHSAPQIVQDILFQTRRLDFDMRTLTTTLANDPALSAKILRLVNSASFGLPRKITSVPQAVMILGQRTLRLVVMTFSLVDRLAKGLAGEAFNSYWQNAIATAIIASRLSRARTDVDPEEAYSAGLLADLGILTLLQVDGERYAPIFKTTPHGEPLLEKEREVFGCDHAQVGCRLLERWGFAHEGALATLYHHQARPGSTGLELVVFTAARLADMLWRPKSEHLGETRSILKSEFDYDTDKLISLALECKDEMKKHAELYGVTLQGELDVAAILDEARKLFVVASLETAMDFDSALSVMGQN